MNFLSPTTRAGSPIYSALIAVVASIVLVGSAWGASNPTFSGRLDFAAKVSVVADVNADGIPDLVAANANGVYVTFGNGDGTFRAGPISTISFQPSAINVLDLNHDGAVDLLMAGGPDVPGCCVAISYGNGDGTFGTAISFSAGENAEIETSAVGDFNGDGITDIVTLGSAGIYMFLGNLSGGFNAPVLTPVADVPDSAFQVLAADFNHDGVLDVVVSTTQGFSVYFGTGTGAFGKPVNTASGFKVGVFTSMTVSDLNGDGFPDVVLVSNQYTFVLIYLGTGSGTFSSPRRVTLPGSGFIIIVDVNGDGVPDLISAGVNVALGKGDGTFRPAKYYQVSSPEQNAVANIVPAPLRKPGLIDLVVEDIYYKDVSILLNDGKGAFQEGNWLPIQGGGAGCSGMADFNGDGVPDLAVTTSSGISVLFATGKASRPFLQGPVTPVANMNCLAVADLNHDGIPDLLVTTYVDPPATSALVAGFIGRGDGTFTAMPASSLPSLGYIAMGDFNGDGNIDYAMNNNYFAFGNGDGTFQAAQPIVASPPLGGFSGIAAADLNGDDKADIVLINGFDYTASILTSNGSGFTQAQQLDTAHACYFAYMAVLTDINGDGKPDLLFACGDSGTPIYTNDGTGNFTYEKTLETKIFSQGTFPVVTDVNGDGILDVVVATTYDLTIFVGQGNLRYLQEYSYPGLGLYAAGAFPMQLHGQSPSAGKPDFAVPDASGRVLTILNTTR